MTTTEKTGKPCWLVTADNGRICMGLVFDPKTVEYLAARGCYKIGPWLHDEPAADFLGRD